MVERQYTVKDKVEIVLEMLKSEASINEICQRHQISSTDAYRWCGLFLEGAKKAFESGSEEPITQEEIEKLKKIIGKE